MLELKEIDGEPNVYVLIIDGIPIPHEDVFAYDFKAYFSIQVRSYSIVEKICSLRFADLPRKSLKMYLACNFDEIEHVESIGIHKTKSKDGFELSFSFEFDFLNWKEFWSVTEYANTFIQVVEASPSIRVELADQHPAQGIRVYFSVNEPEEVIDDAINSKELILSELQDEVISLLKSRVRNDKDSVIMSFDFPEEVRVSCEQYLLYFVQFLKDLGVEATAEVQHQARQVLFSVTPADKDTALDKIRLALATYLQLPASKLVSDDQDILAQRLSANIYHLKGQLALAQAMLQTKDATIEAKQLTIDIQKDLLSGEIVFNSMKDVTPKSEDKEELLGGIVALATYKDKGVEVNLAELYRKLKGLFNDNE